MKKKDKKLLLGVALGTGLFLIIVISALALSYNLPLGNKCIAKIEVNGEITTEGSNSLLEGYTPGSYDIAKAIKEVDEREDVGAILIVINSPGGSVYASREIYQALNKTKKPKVAYLKEMAASGGYYVASGTDYIIADPTTITGSIGAISMYTDLTPLLHNIGVNVSPIKSGKHKDIGSSFREMTPEEKEIMQNIVDEVFEEFKNSIIYSRGDRLDMDKFNKVLDGRILTGRQAKEIGLVDQLGSYDDAIEKAKEMGNIEGEARICEITGSEKGLFSGMENLAQDSLKFILNKKISVSYE